MLSSLPRPILLMDAFILRGSRQWASPRPFHWIIMKTTSREPLTFLKQWKRSAGAASYPHSDYFPYPVQYKCTRLVFSSSATVYGMTENVPIKETEALCAYNFPCACLRVIVIRQFFITFLDIIFCSRGSGNKSIWTDEVDD
jgi:hypothetical protein